MTDGRNSNVDESLQGVDEGKRGTLKRLIGTGAFVSPMLVSFTMADLTIDSFTAMASVNMTGTTAAPTTATPGTTATPTTTLPARHPAKS